MTGRDLQKAATRGEPSYVWREGQDRRLKMIQKAAGDRITGRVLEDGCGVGMYLERLKTLGDDVIGLEYDFPRAVEAHQRSDHIVCAAGENLPLKDASFDLILSHEVLEHVADDRQSVEEMVRVLRQRGRIVIFVPNRGYPFETHGIFWRGKYRFGNIPLVNYLPQRWRSKLAPHVRVYTSSDLARLFADLPVQIIQRELIFGAYDNIIARRPTVGRSLRKILQGFEQTPLRAFGLSHFWVIEKI
jgi:SAM-dependent methyltransferase